MIKLTASIRSASLLVIASCAILLGCKEKTASRPAPSDAPAATAAPAAAPQPPAVPQGPAPAQPTAVPGITPLAAKMDFSLPLQAVSNPSASFAGYHGRQVLVFYFGPTCPHCQAALPQVQAFSDEIRAKGVETVGLATSRSNPEEIQGFIRDYKARIPIFWDLERKFGEAYDVKLLPTLFLIGADGGMRRLASFDGQPSIDALRAAF
jgi:thiol-disulfide isomerase/thioredoxin